MGVTPVDGGFIGATGISKRYSNATQNTSLVFGQKSKNKICQLEISLKPTVETEEVSFRAAYALHTQEMHMRTHTNAQEPQN